MTHTPTCPNCGTALPADAPGGLCPKCLVVAGLMSQVAADPQETVDFTLSQASGHASWPQASLPSVQHLFGGYRIIRPLGKGGMGTVFEAEENASGRRLALKVLSHSLDSEQARTRFFREGRLAASVNHPNSVYVFGTEEINDMPVITMELVPGGTLQEWVKRDGPLPIAQAVDAILQIIAGLEAAAAGGVLHRDIKPSNCFLDPDGTVKVGDFGLSISTLARGETNVTTTGALVGTPAYASPEQLRGDELDARSDIYAVGVTLFYLLTAQTPFKADNVVRLLATVLERPADSPRKLRPEIPEQLSAVVLRCLAKQPAQRFRNYQELRQALLPFTTTAPVPATPSIRCLASVLDYVMMGLFSLALSIFLLPQAQATDGEPASRSAAWSLLGYVPMLVMVLYYALPEGLWGASLGKAICRLRVINPKTGRPSLPRGFLRAMIFLLSPALIPRLIFFLLSIDPVAAASTGLSWKMSLLLFLDCATILLLLSTMRRGNGFAGIHDLLSGTRVIFKPYWQSRPASVSPLESLTTTQNMPQIGPYHVLAEIDQPGLSGTLMGYDARLFRKVWIRRLPNGAPEVAPSLRTMARRGRLRWLAGKRSPDENWDAYEALTGQSLNALLRRPQPWKRVRFWLLDVAEELGAGLKDQSLPALLALQRIWITADGRAKLLDFPAPGIHLPSPTPEPVPAAAPGTAPPGAPDHRATQLFLKEVAVAALEGRAQGHAELLHHPPEVPMPLHARSFLAALPAFPTFDAMIDQLRRLLHKTAEITRARRLALLAGCCLPLAFILIAIPLTLLMNRAVSRQNPEIAELNLCLNKLQTLKNNRVDPDPAATRQALEIYIAHHFRGTVADPKIWNGVWAKGLIPPDRRLLVENLVAAHAADSPEEISQADQRVKPLLPASTDRTSGIAFLMTPPAGRTVSPPARTLATVFGIFYALALVYIFCVALPALLAALLFRGGLLLHGLGLAIVTKNGAPASRGRILWRSCIAWSPLLWLVLSPIFLAPTLARAQTWLLILYGTIYLAPILLFTAAALWSLRTPERALHDRLARTRMVPR